MTDNQPTPRPSVGDLVEMTLAGVRGRSRVLGRVESVSASGFEWTWVQTLWAEGDARPYLPDLLNAESWRGWHDEHTDATIRATTGWHVTGGIIEAECERCGETFNPADEHDIIHLVREDGRECGGLGTITGEWIFGRADQ